MELCHKILGGMVSLVIQIKPFVQHSRFKIRKGKKTKSTHICYAVMITKETYETKETKETYILFKL